MADIKISALTAMTGSNITVDDYIPIVDATGPTTKRVTMPAFLLGVFTLTTALAGGSLAATDQVLVNDGGVAKDMTITAFELGLFTAAADDMTGTNINAANDDLLINDGGTVKRLAVAELCKGIAEQHSNAWSAPTGTAARTAMATYAPAITTAGDIDLTNAQAIENALQDVTEAMHALLDDLISANLLPTS